MLQAITDTRRVCTLPCLFHNNLRFLSNVQLHFVSNLACITLILKIMRQRPCYNKSTNVDIYYSTDLLLGLTTKVYCQRIYLFCFNTSEPANNAGPSGLSSFLPVPLMTYLIYATKICCNTTRQFTMNLQRTRQKVISDTVFRQTFTNC